MPTSSKFLALTPLQESLYYSIVWYPSLGIGLLLLGIIAEIKDEWLVTRTSTYAGILIILSSPILILLSDLVTNYDEVMALGLIASSMMLLIYLGAFLAGFFKASKSIFEYER